ncbi:MAG TPA: isoprenylcysteine carboxylmethyltransferase family protein [Lacunisphaera sp.]|nr:isoprenylcysteine carboxylmethyltransferase family protein [Lacunisphaera sp.]
MASLALKFSIACWCVFYAFWIAVALRAKRTAKADSVAGSVAYRIPLILGVFLLFSSHRLGVPLATRVIAGGTGLALVSMAMSVMGLVICLWARVTLGRNWSAVVVVKQDHELIQAGPYRFVRHPIYTGIIMMFSANVLLDGRVGALVGLVCFIASFQLKLLREEKLMLAEFPGEYPDYCRRVKRLLPFIY